MPVAATAEFWEGLKPITTMLWANALPEIDPPDVANADEVLFRAVHASRLVAPPVDFAQGLVPRFA